MLSVELTVKNMRERFSEPPEGVVENEPTEKRQMNPGEVQKLCDLTNETIGPLRANIEELKVELESADEERAEEVRELLEELEEQLEVLEESSGAFQSAEDEGRDLVLHIKEKK